MHIDQNIGEIITTFFAFVLCRIALWGMKQYKDMEKTFETKENK